MRGYLGVTDEVSRRLNAPNCNIRHHLHGSLLIPKALLSWNSAYDLNRPFGNIDVAIVGMFSS
jgi:hypothetical protein